MTGDTITVTWGEEYYKVSDFNGFRVGPFTMTVTVQVNETDTQAFTRAFEVLENHAQSMFLAKRNGYHERYLARG